MSLVIFINSVTFSRKLFWSGLFNSLRSFPHKDEFVVLLTISSLGRSPWCMKIQTPSWTLFLVAATKFNAFCTLSLFLFPKNGAFTWSQLIGILHSKSLKSKFLKVALISFLGFFFVILVSTYGILFSVETIKKTFDSKVLFFFVFGHDAETSNCRGELLPPWITRSLGGTTRKYTTVNRFEFPHRS